MKKLLALLIACTAITCTFASCGDKEKESSVSGESSVSEESAEEETTTEETAVSENSEEIELLTEPETHEYIDADPTAFLGKWECEKIVVDGEEMADLMGMPIYASYQYDIMEDGTAGLSESLMAIMTEADAVEYTWGLISEEEIEIAGNNGSVIQFTLDGDYLVSRMSEQNTEIYLKKVDEFTEFDFQAYVDNYEAPAYELTPVQTDAEGNIIESTETTTTTVE